MTLNIDEYIPYVDGLEVSRVQKEEIIRMVWALMESQVDQAFGQHPVQQVCGHTDDQNLQSPNAAVESKDGSVSTTFGAVSPGVEKGIEDDG